MYRRGSHFLVQPVSPARMHEASPSLPGSGHGSRRPA
jgi:hypothetical protein